MEDGRNLWISGWQALATRNWSMISPISRSRPWTSRVVLFTTDHKLAMLRATRPDYELTSGIAFIVQFQGLFEGRRRYDEQLTPSVVHAIGTRHYSLACTCSGSRVEPLVYRRAVRVERVGPGADLEYGVVVLVTKIRNTSSILSGTGIALVDC